MSDRVPRAGQGRSLRLAMAPALAVLTGVTILPFIFLVAVSFTQMDLARPESWTDFSRPFAGYERVTRDARFANSLLVQAKLSIATVTLQLGLGLVGALLLNVKARFITLLRISFLIPMVLPPIVGAIIWKVLLTPEISPINWLLGLLALPQPAWLAHPQWALVAIIIADVWQWFPFPLLSVLAALQMIPVELYDAARVDGASSAAIFWNITLPFIRPTLFVVALFRLIDSVKAFPLIYVLTEGGPGTATEATNFYAYLQGFAFGFIGYSSTMAFIMLAMTFALSVVIIRRLGKAVEPE
ncbi:MAG: carbohydrate ABC transporter permease [Candidatus Rokuibacteriota bacterium]